MGNGMRCCLELPKEHVEIQKQLEQEGVVESERKKVLLLGAGSGGKSTFLKQITYLYKYNNDFPELRLYRNAVWTNIFTILRTLCEQLPEQKLQCEEQNSEHVKLLLATEEMDQKNNVEILAAMKNVAKDKSILQVLSKHYEFTINDNAEYFINDIDRMVDIDYEPKFSDVVRTRTKTTGVIKEEFLYQQKNEFPKRYLLVDVGGQRSERHKWFSQFVDIFAVLWFFALSSYDQKLLEDAKVNRMYEELEVFHTTCNNPVLADVSFIVFLNKYDQFIEKISQIPFKCSFQNYEYEGDKHNPEQIIAWLEKVLKELSNRKTLYLHKTTATDTDQMDTVFRECHKIIVRIQLARAGVLQ